MLFKINSRSEEKTTARILPFERVETVVEGVQDAETIRRQMYERIAEGHALEEAEEHARRKWRG